MKLQNVMHSLKYFIMTVAANKVRSPAICLTAREYEASIKLADAESRSWSNWAGRLIRAELARAYGSEWVSGSLELARRSTAPGALKKAVDKES